MRKRVSSAQFWEHRDDEEAKRTYLTLNTVNEKLRLNRPLTKADRHWLIDALVRWFCACDLRAELHKPIAAKKPTKSHRDWGMFLEYDDLTKRGITAQKARGIVAEKNGIEDTSARRAIANGRLIVGRMRAQRGGLRK
jgi:hypothetical protein